VDFGAGGVAAGTGVDFGAGRVAEDGEESEAARQARLIIEVAGLETRALARVAELPGVDSVLASESVLGRTAAPDTSRADADVLELTVAAIRSDDLLRELLAFDGVHIRSVRPGRKMPGVKMPGVKTPGPPP
jgi:hypothetical protein